MQYGDNQCWIVPTQTLGNDEAIVKFLIHDIVHQQIRRGQELSLDVRQKSWNEEGNVLGIGRLEAVSLPEFSAKFTKFSAKLTKLSANP